MNRKLSLTKPSLYAISFIPLALTSYNGLPNPHPLGTLDTVSLLLLVSGVYLLISTLNRKLVDYLHWPLLLFSLFITIASWYYFDYFRSLFNLSVLSIGGDIGDGFKALQAGEYKLPAFIIVVLSLGISYSGLRTKNTGGTPSLFLGSTLLIAGIAGILVVESSIEAYKSRNLPWLHPNNLHPMHALFKAEQTLKSTPAEAQTAHNRFRALNNPEHSQNRYPAAEPDAKPLNLIVILLESFRADLTGVYTNGTSQLTPNFDQIAEQAAVVKNYYSNTTFTISAELSIWCGLYDALGIEKYSYQEEITKTATCLPDLLNKDGYAGFYYHGNKSSFYNRDSFIPKIGFENMYFHADQPQPARKGTKIGWGVDDTTMLGIMLEQLNSDATQKPFFAHITTLSNHYPFSWDFPVGDAVLPFSKAEPRNLWENYQNAVFYTDYALGKFWEEFSASNLYDNTVVIITSDHGTWNFDPTANMSLAEKNERFYRAPLLVYHPAKALPHIDSTVSSHIDIAPTVLELLNIDTPMANRLGKNLFRTGIDPNHSWAIMTKGVDHVLRKGNRLCYFNVDQCQTDQQNCAGWRGEIIFSKPHAPLVACQSVIDSFVFESTTPQHRNAEMQKLFYDAKAAIQHSAESFSKPAN